MDHKYLLLFDLLGITLFALDALGVVDASDLPAFAADELTIVAAVADALLTSAAALVVTVRTRAA